MSDSIQTTFKPKNGQTLKVLTIARISTEHQDVRSLEDQEALCRAWLAQRANLPFELHVISGRGSGESLQRKELREAEDAIESGKYDLVITEDLGRICRRQHSQIFCELCEDSDTRLVAINDNVDTGNSDWRLHAFFAGMRHEMYNADTSKRIRRSLRNRFQQGGVVQHVVYGYIKKPGATSEKDLFKDPAAEPIYEEWFRRLENGATFAEIADRLNEQGILPRPHCRNSRWDCAMVSRITRNPILKGVRVRNRKMSKRINRTGLRRSVNAPTEELLERYCPHLAFIDPERYDRVIRMLDHRNKKYRRKGVGGIDTRKNVPKKRTTWPGQHLRCGVCGRQYYWTGTAQKKMMMCSGAHIYRCWNSVLINGDMVARKLTEAILEEARKLPDFSQSFQDEIRRLLERKSEVEQQHEGELQQKLRQIIQQITHLTTAVAEGIGSRSLLEKLQEREAEQEQIQDELSQIKQSSKEEFRLPTAEQIRQCAEEALTSFIPDTEEVGRLMQRLIPELAVYPYRLCDGGAIVLRAKFKLYLPAFLNGKQPNHPHVEEILERSLIVDLFDLPQRVKYREAVIQMRVAGMTERQVAAALGITHTAAQRAASLDRLMKRENLEDPYLELTSPPEDSGKLRRHKHPRYRFEPLDE